LPLWRADTLVHCVQLRPAGSETSLIRFRPDRWGGRQRSLVDVNLCQFIVSPRPGVVHYLTLPAPNPPVGMPLSPIVAFDFWHPERAEATLAFWRFAQSPRVTRAPSVPAVRTRRRGTEAAFLAWALDIKQAGGSDRDVARALFGPPPRDWADSARRAQIRSLLKAARQLATSTYRDLLKPRRSVPPR
jgi:hypothetical protein